MRTHSDVLDRLIGPSKLQRLELCFTLYVYVLWTIYMKTLVLNVVSGLPKQVHLYVTVSNQDTVGWFFFSLFLFSQDVFFLVVTLL